MSAKPVIQGSYSFLTRTSAFRKLTRKAFAVCDSDNTGYINKDELHAGLLLVHLNLAKYLGSAACYPPSRHVVDQLFEASDDDNNGKIDEEEFTQIMMVCCAQITSRLLVYYAIIILLVPFAARSIVGAVVNVQGRLGWNATTKDDHEVPSAFFRWFESLVTWSQIAETIIYFTLFFTLVPLFFNWIDQSSRRAAEITTSKSSSESAKVTKSS